jgi:hypothetical protein
MQQVNWKPDLSLPLNEDMKLYTHISSCPFLSARVKRNTPVWSKHTFYMHSLWLCKTHWHSCSYWRYKSVVIQPITLDNKIWTVTSYFPHIKINIHHIKQFFD